MARAPDQLAVLAVDGQKSLAPTWIALCLVAAAVVISPWHLTDQDTLSNLAIGRFIVDSGTVPSRDPFTFTDPTRPYSNPEWLADVLWYSVYRASGEPGIVVFKLALVALGWFLALRLSQRRDQNCAIGWLLLLAVLPAGATRFVERNELHACWLVPLYGLLLNRLRQDRRWFPLLVGLGVLWANLHASFVVGWIVVAAHLVDAAMERSRDRKALLSLAALLVLQPVLGMASPQGVHNFDQLIDHARGVAVYSKFIVEWAQLENSEATTGQLSIHLFAIVGLLSFLPGTNRRRIGALLLLVAGLGMAYRAPRLFPVAAVLAGPAVVENLDLWFSQRSRQTRRIATVLISAAAMALLLPAFFTVHSGKTRPGLLASPSSPRRLARFVADHAPDGSLLLNTYNAGPWLIWEAGQRIQIAIDPRNNLGAEQLRRHFEQVVLDPAQYRAEVERFGVNLAMLDLYGDQSTPVSRYLGQAAEWRLVFLDGRYALFARTVAKNESLIAAHAYRVLQARLGFEYLLRPAIDPAEDGGKTQRAESAELSADLQHLRGQAPALADALAGYTLLVAEGEPPPRLPPGPPPRATTRATELLQHAAQKLPPSAHILMYLATAWERQGKAEARAQVMAVARYTFPEDPALLALDAELARKHGDLDMAAKLQARFRPALAGDPWLAMILSGGAVAPEGLSISPR